MNYNTEQASSTSDVSSSLASAKNPSHHWRMKREHAEEERVGSIGDGSWLSALLHRARAINGCSNENKPAAPKMAPALLPMQRTRAITR